MSYARNFRAKRYILRFRDVSTVKVTVPRRGNLKEAREFLLRHIPWLERHFERLSRSDSPSDWHIGFHIYLRGELVPITLDDSVGGDGIRFGTERLPSDSAGTPLRRRIERHLHKLAAKELPPRVADLSARHGLKFSRVSVRNQRTRWGSCSARGTISLNWRLVQTPPHVRDYIILHELCHGKHMNHSPQFWRLVEQVCPEYPTAARWLKEHSRQLR